MNLVKNKLSLFALGKKIIPVFIEEELFYKIKYLCKLIPREEWSGVLFYTVEGSIKNLSTFKITLKDVYPMNKGTGAFTSYEFNEKLVEYRMDNPETLMMSVGHIHSHNVMNTFFSGTDTEEITDNAPNHNYYLSVIVNNYMDFSIRVGFLAKASSYTAMDEDGEPYKIKVQPQEVVFYYNGQIQLKDEQIPVSESFAASVKHIIEEKEKQDKAISEKKNTVFQDNRKALAQNFSKSRVNRNDVDQYDAAMEAFIVELLSQNTPIVLMSGDLSASMTRIATMMREEDKADYIASTLSDYPELYSLYFGGPQVTSTDFMEDLGYVRDRIEEENETINDDVFKTLLVQFDLFAEEFENAEL